MRLCDCRRRTLKGEQSRAGAQVSNGMRTTYRHREAEAKPGKPGPTRAGSRAMVAFHALPKTHESLRSAGSSNDDSAALFRCYLDS